MKKLFSIFCLVRCLLLVSTIAVHGSLFADFFIYNVTAFSPGTEECAAAQAKDLKDKTGVDMALYCLSLHPQGRPAIDKAKNCIESFVKFKKALEGSGVKAGVLVQSILGHWPRVDKEIESWTRTVDSAGNKVRFCPEDNGFAAYITEVFKLLAAEKPAFIMTDDDVRAFSPKAECFCPFHIERFNSLRGTKYTASELRSRLSRAGHHNDDYKVFFKIQREMVLRVLERARKAIDSVDPTIPGGMCVAWAEHQFVVPLAKAIAAKGQTPVIRTSTASYLERMSANSVPRIISRMMGFSEYYKNVAVDLLCESDTFPHNLWSKSSRSFMSHLTTAAFIGMNGAKAWYVNGYKGGMPVSRSYTDILSEHRGFLDTLSSEIAGSSWEGLAIACFTRFPRWHLILNQNEFFVDQDNAGVKIFSVFGIPYYVSRDFDNDGVYVLAEAAEVSRLSNDELEKIFSRKVLVFRDAAIALSARGYHELTGVKTVNKNLVYNFERDEVLGLYLSFSKQTKDYEFVPAQGALVLATLGFKPYAGSDVYDKASPSAVLYSNKLGGRVLSLQYNSHLQPMHLYSAPRRKSLLSMIEKLCGRPLPFVAEHNQDVVMLARKKSDGTYLVFVENINPDPIKRLSFTVPEGAWRVERLSSNGEWKSVKAEFKGGKVVCDIGVAFYETIIMRLSKRSI
jgi:hypothetical protein